jgi:hypothetical protein
LPAGYADGQITLRQHVAQSRASTTPGGNKP